jgi:hypothetical protein
VLGLELLAFLIILALVLRGGWIIFPILLQALYEGFMEANTVDRIMYLLIFVPVFGWYIQKIFF